MTPLGLLLLLVAPLSAAPPDESGPRSAQGHYLKGLLLERRGAEAEALEEFEKAFALDPASAYLCRQAATVALEAGQIEPAARWTGRLKALEPQEPMTHVLLGRVAWARGDTGAAETAFQEALRLDPKSAESIFSLGSLLSARSPDQARKLFERLITQDRSQAAEAHFQLAAIEQKAGREDLAVRHLEQAIELEPAAVQARLALAQVYELRRSTEQALAAYLDVLRYDPQNVALLNHIAEIYYIKGQLDQAKDYFRTALKAAPGEPRAAQWLAMIAEKEGDYAGAAKALRESAAMSEDPALHLRLSYYLTQAGSLPEAVASLEKAQSRWPANDEIAYFLALGYDDIKKPEKAVKLLRGILELKPDYRDARYQLAVLLEKTGDIAAAEIEFRALLARKPNDPGLLNYLGYSLADRGLKLKEAEELIVRAVQLDPTSGAFQDSLGWVFYKQKRLPEALKELEGAAGKLPHDATIWGHLGDVQGALGDDAAAWRSWKKAQALGDDPQAARKAAKAEKSFTPQERAERQLERLAQVHGPYKRFSAVCELRGLVLGRAMTYSAVLLFKEPDELQIDLLGPFFAPLLRLKHGKDGFSMDKKFHIEGLDPQAVEQAAYHASWLLKEFLSGRLFAARPALYRSGWRRDVIDAADWVLTLDAQNLRLESVADETAPLPLRLELGEFTAQKGKHTPGRITVTGKGFTLVFRLQNASADYKP